MCWWPWHTFTGVFSFGWLSSAQVQGGRGYDGHVRSPDSIYKGSNQAKYSRAELWLQPYFKIFSWPFLSYFTLQVRLVYSTCVTTTSQPVSDLYVFRVAKHKWYVCLFYLLQELNTHLTRMYVGHLITQTLRFYLWCNNVLSTASQSLHQQKEQI